jgi:hypothetical protein
VIRPGDPPSSNGERSTALDLAGVFNGAVNRLFEAGLSIAAVLSRPDVDDDVRGRLYDELDGVVALFEAPRSTTSSETATTSIRVCRSTSIPPLRIPRRIHLSHPPPRSCPIRQ